MKKGILVDSLFILLLGSSSCALANLYTEINLGANFVTTSKDLVYPLGTPQATEATFNSAYSNFHGQLALGYDFHATGNWNLAIEGDVDLFTGRAKNNATNWFLTIPAYASERLAYGWEVFALPEYVLNPAVKLFAGPGAAWGQFQINSNNAATAGNLGFTGSDTRWLSGWGVKAGTSINLASAVDLLLIYQFTSYQSVTATSLEPVTAQYVQSQYRPYVSSVMVGLRYQFNTEQAPISGWKK